MSAYSVGGNGYFVSTILKRPAHQFALEIIVFNNQNSAHHHLKVRKRTIKLFPVSLVKSDCGLLSAIHGNLRQSNLLANVTK